MQVWEIAIIVLCVCLILAMVAIVFYHAGKLIQKVNQGTELSSLACLIGFFSASQAHGLRNSTVIQRIVEKYNVIKDPTLSKEAEKLEKEFSKLTDPFTTPDEQSAKDKFSDQHDFDDLRDEV